MATVTAVINLTRLTADVGLIVSDTLVVVDTVVKETVATAPTRSMLCTTSPGFFMPTL